MKKYGIWILLLLIVLVVWYKNRKPAVKPTVTIHTIPQTGTAQSGGTIQVNGTTVEYGSSHNLPDNLGLPL